MDVDLKMLRRNDLRAARRVVIQAGYEHITGAMVRYAPNKFSRSWRSIAALKSAGRQVVLVSPGQSVLAPEG